MKVIRSHPDSNFTIIPNQALRDDRLSYTARGVLHELLSHRSGWETNADIMSARARQQRGAGVGEGRRAIRAAFAELEDAGYMVRVKERIPAGEKGAGRVVTTLVVYDTPQPHRGTAGGTSADGTSVSGMPVTGTSVSGTSSIRTMGEDQEKTIGQEEAGEEHSASLAAARAAGQQAGPPVASVEQQRDLGYEAVDRLPDDVRRDNLLTLERMRPRIYRDCRRKAIAQIERDHGAEVMRRPDASALIDKLSYKFAVLHYSKAESWPTWFLRPLQSVS